MYSNYLKLPSFIYVSIFLFGFGYTKAQGFKLFLIGDTGEDEVLGATMKHFLDTISRYPNSATVFLGDNCYKGLTGGFDSSEKTLKRLNVQLEGLNTSRYRGSVYFIPGNHDWWNETSLKKGKPKLKMEERHITFYLSKNQYIKNKMNTFLPGSGNPIDAVSLNDDKLKLIIIDTHWLIMQEDENKNAKVYTRLDSILTRAISLQQKIVVAAHHPIYTKSKHSKKYKSEHPKTWKAQYIYHPAYINVRVKLESLFSHKNYPIIFASGHDHVLEYFSKDSVQYIVSGAGSKANRYDDDENQDFNPTPQENFPKKAIARVNEGYFELDFTNNNVVVTMIYLDNKMVKEVIK